MTLAPGLRQAVRSLLIVGMVGWLGCLGLAMAQVPVPPLTGHVIDQTATLSTQQKASLEQNLTTLEASKGSQLAVLIVPTSAPETLEQYALRVAEVWKLGRKKVDDGVILVVAKDDRTLRIEVGYGLEGALNDATAKRIISETILPRFRQQDFAGGIEAGVAQITQVIRGEALPPPKAANTGVEAGFNTLRQFTPVLFILAIALGGVLRAIIGKVPGALITGGLVGAVAWFLMGAVSVALLAGGVALVATLLGGGVLRSGMGAFYGGGRGGGFGGGGFRGGGGGFGGGGASGRW